MIFGVECSNFTFAGHSADNQRVVCEELAKTNRAVATYVSDKLNTHEFTFELLCHNQNPIGAIVFNNRLTQISVPVHTPNLYFELPKNGLRIHFFIVFEKGRQVENIVYQKLIDSVIERAKRIEAQVIYKITAEQNEVDRLTKNYQFHSQTWDDSLVPCFITTKSVTEEMTSTNSHGKRTRENNQKGFGDTEHISKKLKEHQDGFVKRFNI